MYKWIDSSSNPHYWRVNLYTHMPHFLYPFIVHRHLRCFHFLPIMNHAAVNMQWICLGYWFPLLWIYTLKWNCWIVGLLLFSCYVMFNSVWPYGVQPSMLLCPWGFPGKNTGVGCHFLLQGTFPTQGLNLSLLCYRWILYHSATWETQIIESMMETHRGDLHGDPL